MKVYIFLLFAISAFVLPPSVKAANDTVAKTVCKLAVGYETVDSLQADLLIEAKREVINELFGELIVASTAVENFVVTSDQIRASSIGFVRVDGSADFRNGESFAEVCVEIVAYVTEDDREKFEPIKLTKKLCDSDNDMTTTQLISYVKDEAIIQALLEFNPKLKGAEKESLLQLVQKVTYRGNGFIADTQTYCATFDGYVVPVEVMAFLETKQETQIEDVQRKITFGGFDQARVNGFSIEPGQVLDSGRTSLLEHFPQMTITSFAELTSETLKGIDILYLLTASGNSTAARPLSETEQANLLDFVKRGGCAILLSDNDKYASTADAANESLLDAFGMDASGTLSGKVVANVSNLEKSLIISGTFGTILSFSQLFPGGITNNGQYGISLASNSLGSALTIIPKDAIQKGSGAVIVFSDVTSFMDQNVGGYFSENESLFLNTVDYCLTSSGKDAK